MAWVVLLASAVLEAVWATALGRSEGLSLPGPTVVFAVGLALSMLGLGHAVKQIPIGTAYAVWTGTGAALTVTWAMLTGDEPVSALKVLFLAGIVAAVVGLKLVPAGDAGATAGVTATADARAAADDRAASDPGAPADAAGAADAGTTTDDRRAAPPA